MKRCSWAESELMQKYHDKEWGVPERNDKKLFEFLILEGAQAGLSWSTILNRREGYRKAFSKFDVKKVALYGNKEKARLVKDKSIIRNKRKIESAINNARAFIKVQKEFGSFSYYIWQFIENKPIKNNFKSWEDMPASTKLSEKISKDLKKRGFSFIGPTIIYAHMQATGMVNDHETSCFRHKEVQK